MIVFQLALCGITTAVGGVAGALAAPSASGAEAAQGNMTAALDARAIQESLRHWTEAAALAGGIELASFSPASIQEAAHRSDYRALAAAGVDTLLEVTLTEAGTAGQGINAPLQLYLQAHVRLIRTRDGAELYATDSVHEGARLKLAEWSEDQAARLLAGLQAGYEALGTHIYETAFLLYPLPDRRPHSGGFLSSAFGLAPVDPRTRGQLMDDAFLGRSFEWTTVDSLRPALRWQRFPRDTDLQAAPEDMGRVANVRYDLVIARANKLAPAEIVYRREGLADAAHAVETSLSPATRYFWTVRARFELDGRERVTEWGSTHHLARDRMTAPSRWSYRFKTP